MKKFIYLLTIALIFVTTIGCGNKQANKNDKTTLTISAAASLRDALKEIKVNYEKKNHVILQLNLGGSGALQKQIEQGASADMFISAGTSQMKALQNKKLIVDTSQKNLLKNDLVLIVSKEFKGKINSIKDINNQNIKLGVGQPNSVPAGQYAKETLTNLNLWDTLSSKFVYGKDVTQIVNYVEKGEAGAGIVYKSDTINLKSASIAETFNNSLHKPIVYPAALIESSKNKEAAQKFMDYLSSEEGMKIFEKYGFKH